MPAAPATAAAIERAIGAVRKQGLEIGVVEITRDGTIRIETRAPESLDASAAPVQAATPKKWARG